MKINNIIMVGVLIFSMGCFTNNEVNESSYISPSLDIEFTLGNRTNQCYGDKDRIIICMGLGNVDKYSLAYNGWDGDCPGAVIDAINLRDCFCKIYGGSITNDNNIYTVIANSIATWNNLKFMVDRANSLLMTNGLLVLMISGHGGQIADWNKDEVDGFDETWCLFDKMVTDDNIFAMLSLLRSDIRIVLINDQCHSEANFKNFVKGSDVYIPRIFKKIGIRGDADISLIQFASCRESEFSYGGMTGGSFINSLILNYKDGITWGEWFNIAKTNIVSKQTPVLIRYGKRADEIVNSLIK